MVNLMCYFVKILNALVSLQSKVTKVDLKFSSYPYYITCDAFHEFSEDFFSFVFDRKVTIQIFYCVLNFLHLDLGGSLSLIHI